MDKEDKERNEKVTVLQKCNFAQIVEPPRSSSAAALSPIIHHANDAKKKGGGEPTQGRKKDGWRRRGTGVERQEERKVRSD